MHRLSHFKVKCRVDRDLVFKLYLNQTPGCYSRLSSEGGQIIIFRPILNRTIYTANIQDTAEVSKSSLRLVKNRTLKVNRLKRIISLD